MDKLVGSKHCFSNFCLESEIERDELLIALIDFSDVISLMICTEVFIYDGMLNLVCFQGIN